MSAPAEALQIINRMMKNKVVPDTYNETRNKKVPLEKADDSMIKSILYASVEKMGQDVQQPTVTGRKLVFSESFCAVVR
jgi:hypothetical protein